MMATAAVSVLMVVAACLATEVARGQARHPSRMSARLAIPPDSDQLIVVSSPTADPVRPGDLATLTAYARASPRMSWRRVFGGWPAETGLGHLLPVAVRREGDGATPIGVYGIDSTIYGIRPNPGGLHYRYHQLVCGDWWDEDPYSRRYNQFVHVPCGLTPGFAAWSEALWTETAAYPYFAVIAFNMGPIRSGADAPGSGIFLHSWIGQATHGCVAVREQQLIRILQWLEPNAHPVIEIGTNQQVSPARSMP